MLARIPPLLLQCSDSLSGHQQSLTVLALFSVIDSSSHEITGKLVKKNQKQQETPQTGPLIKEMFNWDDMLNKDVYNTS